MARGSHDPPGSYIINVKDHIYHVSMENNHGYRDSGTKRTDSNGIIAYLD